MIDIDLIDEDEQNQRSKDNPGFAARSIAELAASFGPNGPKTPLSLRENPDKPGRYIINHGHRRFRAGKRQQLRQLPAFIDNSYTDDDQIIENIHREDLTAQEIANHIARKIREGKKKKEIAERLGKSAAWISQYVTLLNLPVPIAMACREGRVSDVTVINELVRAHRENASEVESWLSNPSQEITRAEVDLLRSYLHTKASEPNLKGALKTVPQIPLPDDDEAGEDDTSLDSNPATRPPSHILELQMHGPMYLKAPVVHVEYAGLSGRLLYSRRPSDHGLVWLKQDDNGLELEVAAEEVRILAVSDGG